MCGVVAGGTSATQGGGGGGGGGGGAGARRKPSAHKRRWGTIIEAARAARMSRFIGRSRSEDSVCDHARASPRYANILRISLLTNCPLFHSVSHTFLFWG